MGKKKSKCEETEATLSLKHISKLGENLKSLSHRGKRGFFCCCCFKRSDRGLRAVVPDIFVFGTIVTFHLCSPRFSFLMLLFAIGLTTQPRAAHSADRISGESRIRWRKEIACWVFTNAGGETVKE